MTFSIVARDPMTGAFGVATATGGPVVGSLVPHARSGVGAIATQGYTNPLYAYDGLAALDEGQGADTVLSALKAADLDFERRQIILVDKTGHTAGWTGSGLKGVANMTLTDNMAAAGNLLASATVVTAMVAAYEASAGKLLEDRLLAALFAGEQAGGDSRGTLSAAIKTVTDQPYPAIDVRVDFSSNPIGGLEVLLDQVRSSSYADFFADLPRRAHQAG